MKANQDQQDQRRAVLREQLRRVLYSNGGVLRLTGDNQGLAQEVSDFRRKLQLRRKEAAEQLGLSGHQLDYLLARARAKRRGGHRQLKRKLKFREVRIEPEAMQLELALPGELKVRFGSVEALVSFVRHWAC